MATARYHSHTIQVSEADADLLTAHRWRVIATAGTWQVAASAPAQYRGDRRRANLVLARLVGARMGFPPNAMVSFRNRDGRDCRRENLRVRGTIADQAGRPKVRPASNPEGLHRHKLGTERPPARYALCAGRQDQLAVCRDPRYIGIAHRVPDPQGYGTDLWQLRIFATGQVLGPVLWRQFRKLITAIPPAGPEGAHWETASPISA